MLYDVWHSLNYTDWMSEAPNNFPSLWVYRR